jgi:hypothetical protein
MYPNTKVDDNETAGATIDKHNLSMLSQLVPASLHLVFFSIKHGYCHQLCENEIENESTK